MDACFPGINSKMPVFIGLQVNLSEVPMAGSQANGLREERNYRLGAAK